MRACTGCDRHGVTASPDDASRLRGLRTLPNGLPGIRRARSRSRIAADAVRSARGDLPGAAGSRGHDLWKRDFTGASSLFGVACCNRSRRRIDAMLDGMRLFGMGFSWGGFESL
jgi:cystathionine beta-lyase